MSIGDDVAVGRVDDHSGSGALKLLRIRLIEKRIAWSLGADGCRTVTNTTAGDAFLIIGDKDGRGASRPVPPGLRRPDVRLEWPKPPEEWRRIPKDAKRVVS